MGRESRRRLRTPRAPANVLLNVKSDDEFVLNIAWLLAALRPTGPYPVLGIAGEQGSAKSMCTNFLRA